MHRGIGTTRAARSQESRPPLGETLFNIAWDLSRERCDSVSGPGVVREVQERGGDTKAARYPVTIASVAPDFVGEAHVRVFVPPYFLKSTARASNASAAILPSPLGYEVPY